jgi:putative ABC transport system substrate-binding protein
MTRRSFRPELSRRALLLGAGGVALWARAAAGQGNRVPTVGIVRVNAQASEQFIDPFRRDMTALGWDDGRNVRFEIRFSDGRNDRVVANVAELVARPVDVLVTFGNFATAAAQRATPRIPIVAMNDDMVGSGLVNSWTRPEGNTTGLSIMGRELDVKRLELLHELVPEVRRIGVLVDPSITTAPREAEVIDAARRFGVEVVPVRVQGADEIARALDAVTTAGVGAVSVLASPMLHAGRALMIERFRQARLPAMHEWPETAEEGGLMGYGARIMRVYRQVATMVDKVLRGAKPAELAIEQPTQFTFVINLRTARALGLTVPAALLGRVDDVVE